MANRGAALMGVAGMITAIVLPVVLSKKIGRRPPPDGRGDVDMDGWVTKKDSALVSESLIENILLSPEQLIRADVNLDGVVNIFDVLLIDQYIAGQTDFPS